jgi:DNA topoisomerase-1
VQVLSGRYGPYVKHGKVNATIPKDRDPEQVTMAEAVELIAARAAKEPAKKRAAKSPAKKPARKSAKSNKEAVEETAS